MSKAEGKGRRSKGESRSIFRILLIFAFSLSPFAFYFSGYTQAPENPPAIDNATINLHRWGAVTIFHGLPSDRVNAIAEDSGGLLWFGTDNGLVRYDGRNVEPLSGETALPSRRILSLKLDRRGNLLIGTDAGAARLVDGRVENFIETRGKTVTGIAASAKNEIVMVTLQGEVIAYREQSESEYRSERYASTPSVPTIYNQVAHQSLKSPDSPNEALELATVFAEETLVLIGSRGRGIIAKDSNLIKEFIDKPPRPYFVSSIFSYDDKHIYFGEDASPQAGGIWMFKESSLTRLPVETGAVTSIHGGNGELCVGTNRRGAFLLRQDGTDAKLLERLTFENTAGGLRSNHINAIFRDREGVVWFGTDRGVCRYDRDGFRASNVSENAQSNFVRSLLHASSGESFSGTNRGLFRSTNSVSWAEVAELAGRSVYALHEDKAGSIWAGTSSGLFIKARGSDLFTTVNGDQEAASPNEPAQSNDELPQSPPAPNPQSAPRDSVRAVASFRGVIYAAIYGRGVERVEQSEDGFKRSLVLSDKAAQHAVCFDVEKEGSNDAALWFGTTEGALLRYDGSQIASFEVSGGAIRALKVSGDRVWIGASEGLYLREDGSIRMVKSEIDVRAIVVSIQSTPAVDGKPAMREIVWCATQNSGLLKMVPAEKISIRFDTEQGLASQQVFALAPDGDQIMIGTNRGVVVHRQSAIEPGLQVKRLVADQIYLPEFLTAELSLPHTQQNLLLEVTGIGTRTFPSQFQYEFKLQTRLGEEIDSIQTSAPQFEVKGLGAGGYRIVARAISRDLVYSPPLVTRFRILDAPFPWSTILLASLLGAAIAAGGWAFYQQHKLARANRALEETNVELRETRLRLANETEAERSRIARDLHDQTLADLRHLLVLTDQLDSTTPGPQPPTPAMLRGEIESISSEIRHICEDLSPSVLENIGFLPALEWALSDAVAHLPPEEKFSYEFKCEPDLEERLRLSHIEQIQLYRIVQEALNNICRHAKARRVKMSVRSENSNNLAIEIEDDGAGFDGATANRTGHGIANIRSRANLIGAEVVWEKIEPGCRVIVRK